MSFPAPKFSIEDIDAEIASGSPLLAFRPAIEHAFERDTADERVRMFLVSSFVAVVLYDLFLYNDYITLTDRFPELVVARLAIFTPALILMMITITRCRNTIIRETFASALAVLAVALPMIVMVFSDSPDRLSYQYGSLIVMMFAAVIQRLRFRYAALSLVVIVAIQTVTTKLSGIFTVETFATNVVFFSTASILLLVGSYFLELSNRRSFLFSLRSSLLHDQLLWIARVDPLTELFNRRYLDEAARTIWAEAEEAPQTVTAILLDIDHFKAFNDAYGHSAGDVCLRAVSAAVAGVAAKHSGVAFRFGGEEILVLLPRTELGEAREAADEIRLALQAEAVPHPVLGEGRLVTASLGVAGVVAPQTALSSLVEAADTALYAAKRAGRDCIWPPRALAAEGGVPGQAARAA